MDSDSVVRLADPRKYKSYRPFCPRSLQTLRNIRQASLRVTSKGYYRPYQRSGTLDLSPSYILWIEHPRRTIRDNRYFLQGSSTNGHSSDRGPGKRYSPGHIPCAGKYKDA